MADIKVMLADGHALVRAGVRKLLEEDAEIKVWEEARDGEECIARMEAFAGTYAAHRMLLLEISLGKTDGFRILQQAKASWPDMGVLILTAREEAECLSRAMELGADGYLSKDCSVLELKTAFRSVLNGETYIQPRLRALRQRKDACGVEADCHKRKWESLTDREREVLAHVAEGMLNKEIASFLGISEQTVKNHLSSIFRKLDVMDRTQAAVFAIRRPGEERGEDFQDRAAES